MNFTGKFVQTTRWGTTRGKAKSRVVSGVVAQRDGRRDSFNATHVRHGFHDPENMHFLFSTSRRVHLFLDRAVGLGVGAFRKVS
jgi:hypothetical protein